MFGIRKRTLIIGTVIGAFLATGAVASRMHSYSIEDRADFATYMITKKLDLNDAQQAQLDKLAQGWVSSIEPAKMFRQSMLSEVKELASGDQLSVDQISAIKDKIETEIDRRTDTIIPQFVAFYNGLNSDQKAKIVARLEDVSKHMNGGEMHGNKKWGGRHWGNGIWGERGEGHEGRGHGRWKN